VTAPETAAPSVVSAAPAGGPPAAAPVAAPGRRGAALVVAAVAVTVVLWASAFIGVRAAGHDYDPGALALGRQLAGSIGLTVIVAVRWLRSGHRPVLPRGRVLVGVLAWGVGWFSLYNLALNAAERHLDAGTTALLVNVAPVLVAVLAGVLLGEGFPRRLLVGMAAAFAGVAVIAAATSSGERDVLGVALGLTAAALYAAGATSQKRLLARVDALTALPNRIALREWFEERMAAGTSLLAVHYIDLNDFKPVNDSYGHPVGDALLALVGKRIAHTIRETDIAARLGGDEFAVIQHGISDAAEAARLADRLAEAIARPYRIGDHLITISTGLGYVVADGQAEDLDHLLGLADKALYASKRTEGRVTQYEAVEALQTRAA